VGGNVDEALGCSDGHWSRPCSGSDLPLRRRPALKVIGVLGPATVTELAQPLVCRSPASCSTSACSRTRSSCRRKSAAAPVNAGSARTAGRRDPVDPDVSTPVREPAGPARALRRAKRKEGRRDPRAQTGARVRSPARSGTIADGSTTNRARRDFWLAFGCVASRAWFAGGEHDGNSLSPEDTVRTPSSGMGTAPTRAKSACRSGSGQRYGLLAETVLSLLRQAEKGQSVRPPIAGRLPHPTSDRQAAISMRMADKQAALGPNA
jgi:hypothetical protein